jgi:hypothetical protein
MPRRTTYCPRGPSSTCSPHCPVTEALADELIFWANYLGDNVTFALNFSRRALTWWRSTLAPRVRRPSGRQGYARELATRLMRELLTASAGAIAFAALRLVATIALATHAGLRQPRQPSGHTL